MITKYISYFVVLLGGGGLAAGCGTHADLESSDTSSGALRGVSTFDDSREAKAVLRLANTLTYDQLLNEVGLAESWAWTIWSTRRGADETLGTADDGSFDLWSLNSEFAGGARTYDRLLDYARRVGAVPASRAADIFVGSGAKILRSLALGEPTRSTIYVNSVGEVAGDVVVTVDLSSPLPADLTITLRHDNYEEQLENVKFADGRIRYVSHMWNVVDMPRSGQWRLEFGSYTSNVEVVLQRWSLSFPGVSTSPSCQGHPALQCQTARAAGWIPRPPPPPCPLVIQFSDDPVEFLGRSVPFDFFGRGRGRLLDWVMPRAGLLAVDTHGDRRIRVGAQLFGTETLRLDGSGVAANGFEALAQHDLNRDAVIDAKDPIFSKLVAWFDENSDGVSDSHEVKGMAELGITALSASYRALAHTTRAPYVGLKGTFTYVDGAGRSTAGQLVDVFFPAAGR
jgi:hypothetical protein